MSINNNKQTRQGKAHKNPIYVRGHALKLPEFLVAFTLLLSGCNEAVNPPAVKNQATEASAISAKAKLADWGVDLGGIAKDIKPGDDFYRYVNKGWLDTTKIPQGLPGTDSFTELHLLAEKNVAEIIKELVASQPKTGTAGQRIADFYNSYMDIAGRNQRGMDMLKGELDEILAAKNRSQLAGLVARVGHNPPVSVQVIIDSNNPKRYIAALEQAGLGLPDRDFYLLNKEPFISHRSAYLSYIEGVLTRAGLENSKKRAKAILDFEKKLAQGQWPQTQLRNPVKAYHVMGRRKLQAYAPGFDWGTFLQASGYGQVENFQLKNDSAIVASAALFAKTPIETLRDYVAFQYLNNHAEQLSEPWADAHFDLFSRRLTGIAQQRPLAARAVASVNATLGEEVGRLYVQRYFPEVSKVKTEEMVAYILEAMKEHLQKLDWMDEGTRKEALAKLAKFSVGIGYPSQWHDFSSMLIRKDDLVGNLHQQQIWARKDALAKLNEPVRRWEWSYPPQEVKAAYEPDVNGIVFLAAILQPPFFNPEADPAVNFGAIGAVVGHEIGHGFDDQGSQFDGDGKLRNWWTKASSKNFKAKTDRLVAQYNGYSPVKGIYLNGQLTLGENIGDMSGAAVAYTAYQKYAAAKYPNATAPVLDGYTGYQRFFLGFAQMWRNIATDGRRRTLALIDPHSPGEFRTNGILRNFDPWYEAFGVTENNALFLPKKDRISIW